MKYKIVFINKRNQTTYSASNIHRSSKKYLDWHMSSMNPAEETTLTTARQVIITAKSVYSNIFDNHNFNIIEIL